MPWSFECAEIGCNGELGQDSRLHRCPRCGNLLEVRCELSGFSGNALRSAWLDRRRSNLPLDRSGVWRFCELVSFYDDPASIVSLAEGRTPLLEAPRAGDWAGGIRLSVKHQGANPTGSFKDLGMTAAITRAVALGVRVVACASTGNTSSSMAAYAARAGLRALVFVPAGKIAAAKLAQAVDLGAYIVELGENFDQAFELVRQISTDLGLYLVNSVNPFRIEGQKTLAVELLEQRDWNAPDYIVVPGGNLGNVSAIAKGLRELRALGLATKTPQLVVVQAAGADAFCRLMASGAQDLVAVKHPETEATAIRIGNPANWRKARRALAETRGLCVSVTDAEIYTAKCTLAADGIGCEPASAATLAGIRKLSADGSIAPGSEVVAVLTGHQLKDPDYVIRHAGEIECGRRLQVEPEAAALRRAVERLLKESE
jgi:threonine synthase